MVSAARTKKKRGGVSVGADQNAARSIVCFKKDEDKILKVLSESEGNILEDQMRCVKIVKKLDTLVAKDEQTTALIQAKLVADGASVVVAESWAEDRRCVTRHVLPNDRTLEVGCGRGVTTAVLAAAAARATRASWSSTPKASLRHAGRRRAPLHNGPGAQMCQRGRERLSQRLRAHGMN